MVGLPGSGKSLWVQTHMKKHPERKYRLLGTEELLACMMVSQNFRVSFVSCLELKTTIS